MMPAFRVAWARGGRQSPPSRSTLGTNRIFGKVQLPSREVVRFAAEPGPGFPNSLSACYLTSEVPDQGFCRFVRRVAVREYGLRMIMCTRQRTTITNEGRDGQLAKRCL